MARKRKVTIEGLGAAINEILQEYGNDIDEALDPVLKKATQTARSELRATSPKRSGEYKKGWQYKKDRESLEYTIYNGVKPGLTHLLENGHAKRNGGRVPAYPHIKEVEDKMADALPDEVKDAIEHAGR